MLETSKTLHGKGENPDKFQLPCKKLLQEHTSLDKNKKIDTHKIGKKHD